MIKYIRYWGKRWLGSYFIFYWFISDHAKKMRVYDKTDIIIEGFPRSANSFAVRAFIFSNPEKNIAHHIHAPIQILEGIRLKKPTILLLRKPEDAILSFLLRNPETYPISYLLNEYITFHKKLRNIRKQIVIAEFDIVTKDFGFVIRKVNKKFNVNFNIFLHSEENVNTLFSDMRDSGSIKYNNDSLRFSIPLLKKNQFKAELKGKIFTTKNEKLLREANELYYSFKKESI